MWNSLLATSRLTSPKRRPQIVSQFGQDPYASKDFGRIAQSHPSHIKHVAGIVRGCSEHIVVRPAPPILAATRPRPIMVPRRQCSEPRRG